ncbi:MAG TPA: hypothetical protein VHS99_09435 [Chloroflexota bacterium]|jgi:hypothetical protein|nr:hypothetical protein [Chloroflexota bacterium]
MLALVALAVLALTLSACGRWPWSQEQAPGPAAGTAGQGAARAVPGSAFNRHFPPDGTDGFGVVFTQEREGFAQAELTKGGPPVAILSISDTVTSPDALTKFRGSTRQIAGYPAADVGANSTAILVADRFQVQVRSNDPSFSNADRVAWLTKFRLAELAQLASRS